MPDERDPVDESEASSLFEPLEGECDREPDADTILPDADDAPTIPGGIEELTPTQELRSAKTHVPLDEDVTIEGTVDREAQTQDRLPSRSNGSAAEDETQAVDLVSSKTRSLKSASSVGSTRNTSRGPVDRLEPVIAGYDILGYIGGGAMGHVWLAKHQIIGREVALKVPSEGSLTSDRAKVRFLRELQHTAQCDHPNIAKVYDAVVEGVPYYAMELIEGAPLDEYIREAKPPRETMMTIIIKMARAMDYAFRNYGIIHRDLKPGNVMMGKDGEPKIVDFGLAKTNEPEPDLDEDVEPSSPRLHSGYTSGSQSIHGEIIGTPTYMANEQALGHVNKLDSRVDTYAIGTMLYEALSGKLPYNKKGGALAIVGRKRREGPVPILELKPQLHPDLAAVVMKSIAVRPDDRYLFPGDFADDLEAYGAQRPVAARHPRPPLYAARLFLLRNRFRFLLVVAALLLSGGALATIQMSQQRASDAARSAVAATEAAELAAQTQREEDRGELLALRADVQAALSDGDQQRASIQLQALRERLAQPEQAALLSQAELDLAGFEATLAERTEQDAAALAARNQALALLESSLAEARRRVSLQSLDVCRDDLHELARLMQGWESLKEEDSIRGLLTSLKSRLAEQAESLLADSSNPSARPERIAQVEALVSDATLQSLFGEWTGLSAALADAASKALLVIANESGRAVQVRIDGQQVPVYLAAGAATNIVLAAATTTTELAIEASDREPGYEAFDGRVTLAARMGRRLLIPPLERSQIALQPPAPRDGWALAFRRSRDEDWAPLTATLPSLPGRMLLRFSRLDFEPIEREQQLVLERRSESLYWPPEDVWQPGATLQAFRAATAKMDAGDLLGARGDLQALATTQDASPDLRRRIAAAATDLAAHPRLLFDEHVPAAEASIEAQIRGLFQRNDPAGGLLKPFRFQNVAAPEMFDLPDLGQAQLAALPPLDQARYRWAHAWREAGGLQAASRAALADTAESIAASLPAGVPADRWRAAATVLRKPDRMNARPPDSALAEQQPLLVAWQAHSLFAEEAHLSWLDSQRFLARAAELGHELDEFDLHLSLWAGYLTLAETIDSIERAGLNLRPTLWANDKEIEGGLSKLRIWKQVLVNGRPDALQAALLRMTNSRGQRNAPGADVFGALILRDLDLGEAYRTFLKEHLATRVPLLQADMDAGEKDKLKDRERLVLQIVLELRAE